MPGGPETAMDVSQYKVDYQPYSHLERTQRIEIRPQWDPPTGRVNGQTETAEQFPAHLVEPRKLREKAEWRPPADKFTGISVNKTDYLPKYLPKEQAVRPRDELERSTAPFAGTAGSREEFKAWASQPRYRHEYPSYQKPDGAMASSTSYLADFALESSHQQLRLPPIRPAAQTQPQKPFQGLSESFERYRGYGSEDMAGAKQPSCRPNLQYRPPSRPLETRSSYAGDFAPLGASERTRPVLHPGELSLPSNPMESGTTSKGDFAQPESPERRQPIRHGGELYWPSDAFAGQTTQRDDFSPRNWQPRTQPILRSSELQLPTSPFAARTLAQDDFVARPGGERPRPVRPPGELRVPSDTPMEATTTSRDVYTPKQRNDPPPRRMQPQLVARG